MSKLIKAIMRLRNQCNSNTMYVCVFFITVLSLNYHAIRSLDFDQAYIIGTFENQLRDHLNTNTSW